MKSTYAQGGGGGGVYEFVRLRTWGEGGSNFREFLRAY